MKFYQCENCYWDYKSRYSNKWQMMAYLSIPKKSKPKPKGNYQFKKYFIIYKIMAQYAKYSNLGKKDDSVPCQEIQNKEHKKKLIETNKVVCIDIHASWCGPCKEIAPDYNKMAKTFGSNGNCILVKEDLDLKITPDIKQVPTFHFYKKGVFVHSVSGADLKNVESVLKELTSTE